MCVVALRKESVDRNQMGHAKPRRVIWSLSARRAWIEIMPERIVLLCMALSLSARRAWIEIDFAGSAWVPEFVALRKESVDRNTMTTTICIVSKSRSPQGERG